MKSGGSLLEGRQGSSVLAILAGLAYLDFMESIFSYKSLLVWQKSMDLVVRAYQYLDVFLSEELYGLSSQIKKSAISISSNIAEGRRRISPKEYKHFLSIAYGSGAELETQIEISKRLGFGKEEQRIIVEDLLCEVMKMLNKMLPIQSKLVRQSGS